mgnify:CR=1 FL=1
MNMREFLTLFSLASLPTGTVATVYGIIGNLPSAEQINAGNQLYERMGIALIALLIAGVLGWILYKKGLASDRERIALQTLIAELNTQQLATMKEFTVAQIEATRMSAIREERMEQASKESTSAILRLTAKLKRGPHVLVPDETD